MSRPKEVILYTQPGCGPCVAVKRFLVKHEIAHLTLDIRENPEALKRVQELGYNGTPVVEVVTRDGNFHWKDFRIDKLTHLKDITR